MRTSNELQEHFRQTYLDLRLGIGLLGGALPFVVGIGGVALDKEPLRGAISAYYYSPSVGDLLVGLLVAVGVGLYLYKGFSPKEDHALNLAGTFALGVALVPTTADGQIAGPAEAVHFMSAVLFFVCIAYVALFRAKDSLRLISDPDVEAWYRKAYHRIGIAMLVSPAVAIGLALLFSRASGGLPSFTFFFEAVPVWCFAAFWLVKRREMKWSRADERAASGKLIMSTSRLDGRPALVQIEPDEAGQGDWGALADRP